MRLVLLTLLLAALVAPASATAADPPANVQGDAGHTGAVAADLGSPMGKRWVREDLGESFGPPVIAEGRVFVVSMAGDPYSARYVSVRLHALDAATGATLWSQPVLKQGIAYGDGQVYAITAETTFQAFDASTGAARWTRRFDDDQGLEGPPTAAPGEVYVHGDRMYALKASDGTDRWVGERGYGVGNVAVTTDRVFGSGGGGAVAFERRLGIEVWTHSGAYSEVDGPMPVAAQGRLYVGHGAETTILDQGSGSVLGAYNGGLPAVAGGRAFNTTPDGALRAVDVESGATIWERPIADRPRTAPLVVGDVVYVREGAGGLVGLDAASGAERFRSFTRVVDDYASYTTLEPALAARGDRLVVPYRGKLIGYGPGADAPGIDPDPFRAPGAVSLKFEEPTASLRRTFPRSTVLLRAEYVRREGQGVEDSPVELQEDLWPFDEDWRTVQNGRREYSDTRLEFGPVRPDRNARYRLRYAGVDPPAITDPLTVWVELGVRVRYKYLSRTRLRALVTLRGPQDALRRRTRFHFYFFRKRTNRATRIKSVTLRRRGATLSRRTVMRVPRSFGRRDYVFPCYRETLPDAWGKPVEGLHLCGRRRL